MSALSGIRGPLVFLGAVALGVGVWIATLLVPVDESEIIARYAAEYHRTTGAPVTDCLGRPSEVSGLKLYVVCRPAGGETVVFLVNHRGRVVENPSLARILREG